MKANRLFLTAIALSFQLTSAHSNSNQTVISTNQPQVYSSENATSAPPDSLSKKHADIFDSIQGEFDETKTRAEKGDSQAQYKLGYIYASGDGVQRDSALALKWYRKAADQNSADAQFALGDCYIFGLGVARDEAEAENWWRKAAGQNPSTAQSKLGDRYSHIGSMYFYGWSDVAKDEVEAVKWYRKAIEQNHTSALWSLGVCYQEGRGVAKDVVEAVKLYRRAAERGDSSGQDSLGEAYRDGDGVTKDDTEAVKWFRKAAEQGSGSAQFHLGVMFELGRGVPKDSTEATRWFHKAADRPEYESNMQAATFLKAAKGGAGDQFFLGWMFLNGLGVPENREEAVMWLRKSAVQNHAEAQYILGGCYSDGNGVPKDEVEGTRWCSKAANQGHAAAQNDLGVSYAKGQGVPQDYTEAYKWYNLAAAQGNATAKKNRDEIVRFMTGNQIAEAQRMSRDFKPHKTSPSGSNSGKNVSTQPSASGTGFFITDNGYLISNNHVVEDANQVRVVTSAGIISAKVIRVDSGNDLALLKAEGKFSPLPLAASRGVKLGGTVATVGFPNIGLQGFAPKLAKGEIASLSGAGDDARYFQISVPVQPGNSGGALVDERGNVVGVVSAKLSAKAALAASGALPENVNYAVKSSFLLSFLESVPEVSAKLREPNTKAAAFEDVVKSAQDAAVLVLVY